MNGIATPASASRRATLVCVNARRVDEDELDALARAAWMRSTSAPSWLLWKRLSRGAGGRAQGAGQPRVDVGERVARP